MQINRSQRSNNYTKGRPYGIKSITVHHWGIPGQSHSNVVRYLCRKNGSTSAHYVVSGGGGVFVFKIARCLGRYQHPCLFQFRAGLAPCRDSLEVVFTSIFLLTRTLG